MLRLIRLVIKKEKEIKKENVRSMCACVWTMKKETNLNIKSTRGI